MKAYGSTKEHSLRVTVIVGALGRGEGGWLSNRRSAYCHKHLDFTPEDSKPESAGKNVSSNIWGGSKVNFSHRTLNEISVFW